jgi:hypothetical protein
MEIVTQQHNIPILRQELSYPYIVQLNLNSVKLVRYVQSNEYRLE